MIMKWKFTNVRPLWIFIPTLLYTDGEVAIAWLCWGLSVDFTKENSNEKKN